MEPLLDRVRGLLSHRVAEPAFLALAVFAYAYFNVARVKHDYTNDFYVYYIAAAAFAGGEDAYSLTFEQFHAWAQQLGVPDGHAYPYYYPPLPALMVWPLTGLDVQTASLLWAFASAAAMSSSATSSTTPA